MNLVSDKAVTEFTEFGRELVFRTGELIRTFDRERLATETKQDGSPVTAIDLAVEKLIVGEIQKRYPTHGIIGEEGGGRNETAEFCWTIDPIDGTQNLAAGVPTYGTMLALRYQGRSIVGVIDHPALGLTYWGGEGQGAFCNGERLSVDASRGRFDLFCTSTRSTFERSGGERLFDALHSTFPYVRIYYDCFAHTQVAHGRLGAMVEWGVHIWDLAPTSCLVRAAGGEYVELPAPEGRVSAIFGRAELVAQLEECLRPLLR